MFTSDEYIPDFIPETLRLDENIIFSYKPKQSFLKKILKDEKTYFITDKRIFYESENILENIKKKKSKEHARKHGIISEIPYKKIIDVFVNQSVEQEVNQTGTITLECSNSKHNTLLTKKYYFELPEIKKPQYFYMIIKSLIINSRNNNQQKTINKE